MKDTNNILEGTKVTLRALEPSDINYLYEWENDSDSWFVSNTLTPYSKYILQKYIENSHLDIYQTRQLRLMIICKETNLPIGTIDLFDFDPFHNRAGVGILIAKKEMQQKGFASEAMEILINYSFNHLNLHQLYCNITTNNTKSISLFKKYNFKISGEKKQWLKYGETWVDEYFLQLIHA
ncbi:MAG: GNAT family N-acetyltransferase [Bacteroidetes bacterium GWF2_33_38]|nr:MAG: GNAT family N-acetyltransferase [Bacteroidetes bacterium GWF2_33_38]OFY72739.1 MAG: GNAT family N-acetyltransferase [Bacteroidetes bacterium RIFOXYA12_FULL_33_9]OFY90567.1 MAG: GNAT family N-acetyltransferase [Bacteroidetes bacterium RIFOXYA2_FULL_33_7]HBX49587.1 GNAT family N-acetyltransferase [Bacteroidales bacterium]